MDNLYESFFIQQMLKDFGGMKRVVKHNCRKNFLGGEENIVLLLH